MLPAKDHAKAIDRFLEERRADGIRLRLATEADAAFLLGLRLDSLRNQNISSTSSNPGAQVEWMRNYALRHAAGGEAYFVIESEGGPQGSIRLYDYLSERDSFCWGSWIIRLGAPLSTAYQSAIIVYDLAFGELRFSMAHFDVRQANVSVWKFHEKMGARLIREDVLDRHYEYSVADYRLTRSRLAKFTQQRPFL